MKKEEIEDYRKSLQLFFRIFDNTKVLGMTKISLLESIYAVTQKTDIKVKITQDICRRDIGGTGI